MDIIKLSAIEMKEKLINKEISSRELIEAHFNRIEEVEGKLNAFINLNKEEALKAGDKIDEKIRNKEELGVLAGIPICIKDNIITKDMKTTCGSKMLENFVPPYDATVIEKIKQADGIIIGKTNMDEFAIGSSTKTSYFGSTKNPLDLERVPGGSSGGSAAAVKAGEAALGLGSDTGGSIRQPASFCGLVGIKPSYGLVSRYGLVSTANSMDQIGVFGRDVSDAMLMLFSITGYDIKDSTSSKKANYGVISGEDKTSNEEVNYLKGMKVALPKEYLDLPIDNKVKEEFLKTIKIFEELGADVEQVSLPNLKYAQEAYFVISAAEISSNLSRYDGIRYGYRAENYETLDELYINTRSEGFGEEAKRKIMLGTYYLSSKSNKEYYKKAVRVRTLINNDFNKVFEKHDIILSPTTSILPFKLKENIEEPLSMYKSNIFTAPVNLAGICAMSIPCGYIEGLPVGLQIIGDRFKEENIIKAALSFEKYSGIKNEIPSLGGVK